MKNFKVLVVAIMMAFTMSSCYTMTHQVGKGAQGSSVEKGKQWFALWGLVPISKADSKTMAGGATDYTITTKHSFIDLIISGFTNIVTISVKTVEVKK
jgi:hypothetical protein